jgi:uncharacterized Tic20 family protein
MENRPRSRMPGLVLLIIGVCLSLGSCGPFGYSIKRAMDARVAAEFPMQPGTAVQTGPLSVSTGKSLQLAIALEVSTDSVQESTGSMDDDKFEGRFHFPVTYTVRTPEGRTVHMERTAVDWDSGTRTIAHEDTGPQGGIIALESSFEKFDPPPGGTVNVEATLEPDSRYAATADRIRLLVYDNVSQHMPWVLAGVAMLALGGVLAVVGGVLLITSHSSGPAPGPGTYPVPEGDDDPSARNWAMLCHLSALLTYVGIPMGNIIGPLVVWLIKRNEFPLVDDQGKESLNFQISVLIYSAISFALTFVFIGFPLLFALVIFHFVMSIVAAIRASNGLRYRYPLTIRLIR